MSGIVSSVDTFDSLQAACLNGEVCLTATVTRRSGGNIPLRVPGLLLLKGGKLLLQLRAPGPSSRSFAFRRGPTKVVPISWIRILADGHLVFRLEHLYPGNETWHSDGTYSCEFEAENLIYEPSKIPRGSESRIEIRALIPSTKLRSKNTYRTTTEKWEDDERNSEAIQTAALSGVVKSYRYTFRQKDDDIEVLVRLVKGHRSRSASFDLKFYRALLSAFNWINGGTPFERFLTHHRGSRARKLVTHRWTGAIAKSRLISADAGGQIAPKVLEVTVPFLQASNPLSNAVNLLLWQYREATSSGSVTLGALLQLCSLLEGLLGLVLRYKMRLSRRKIDALPIPPGGQGRAGSAEARFYHATTYLGFNWASEFEPAFHRWKDVRNKLAHGEISKISEESGHDVIGSYHTVLQAFNAALLKTMGYRGNVKVDGGWFAVEPW